MILIHTSDPERVALHIHHQGAGAPSITVAPSGGTPPAPPRVAFNRGIGWMATTGLVVIAAVGGYVVAPRVHGALPAAAAEAAWHAARAYPAPAAPGVPAPLPPSLQQALASRPAVMPPPGASPDTPAATAPDGPLNAFGLGR
jgi:hypothetical protein